MFVNEYKDTVFDVPVADNNTFKSAKKTLHGFKVTMVVGQSLAFAILKVLRMKS